jgi:sodium-dependent dicarboxylate transporter 2/3/5
VAVLLVAKLGLKWKFAVTNGIIGEEKSMSEDASAVGPRNLAQHIGFWLGPLVAFALFVAPPPEGLTRDAFVALGLLVWMAVWWATEAVPIPATSLLPLVVLPLAGLGSLREIAQPYADPIVLLLLGGFIIAIGIERWGLHKRIALNIVAVSGARLKTLIGGFMLAAAVLSMWISNTSTTLMMAPIALSVALSAGAGPRFATALMLGLAYAASIGGVATPVGTPTNLIAMGWLEENAGVTITFAQWMSIGVPAMLIMLPIAWLIVTQGLKANPDAAAAAREMVLEEKRSLGQMTTPEARIAMVFVGVALLWIFREQLVKLPLFSGLTDMGIAIIGAVAMFVIPAGSKTPGEKERALLAWEDAKRVPWGVFLLFGGGMALAASVQRSGLADWLGTGLAGLGTAPAIILILMVVTLIIFLTEIMSNVAAMTTFLPVLGALAVAVDANVAALVIPAALAASCAYMLPIATGPNAVVFATERVPINAMIRAGLWLNLACIAVITAIGYWMVPSLFAS